MFVKKALLFLSVGALSLCLSPRAFAQYDPPPFVKTTSVSGEINYANGTENGSSRLYKFSSVGNAVSVGQETGPLHYESSADVENGTLHANTSTTYDPLWRPGGSFSTAATRADAQASWSDTLVILGGTGLATGRFNAIVDGHIKGAPATSYYSETGVRFLAQYLPGTGSYGSPSCGYFGEPPCTPADYVQGLGLVDRKLSTATLLSMRDDMLTEFTFAYGKPFRVSAELRAFASDGGFSDFSGTAAFGLVLPDGASLASSSGYDYGVKTVPVPEPETYAMTAVGLALLLLWKDRSAHPKRRLEHRPAAA